ncbi:MAG: DNA-processing protein DprA [bacterium]|nr:DNA-processing protein DprA [bacterium]
MLPEKEIETILKLSTIKNLSNSTLREIILRFKPISAFWGAPLEELVKIGDENFISTLKNTKTLSVDAQIKLLKTLNIHIVTTQSAEYPANLKELPDTPPILYMRGEVLDTDTRSIAIIGSRTPTHYGKLVTETFTQEFVMAGITVVSGLARGIDTYAHRETLALKGRTIAVIGSGIDIIYPPENRELFNKIYESGAVISEFPLGTQPWAGNFPARNRIISGLSKAIVVIEASLKSGVFSTVEWALKQGKEVFAVPGNITSENSKGTNKLIKDGAIPVTSAKDVLEYLGILPIISDTDKKTITLTEEENTLFNILDYEPIHLDKLAITLNLPVQKVLSLLLNLELKGIVRQMPGRNFAKNKY